MAATEPSLPPIPAGRGRRLALYALGALAMLAISALFRQQMLTEWDSWEYASLAVQGKPSHLCLQRWWFIFFMRAAWLGGSAVGVPVDRCYVPMQLAVAAMSAAAIAAVMHWTWLVTRRLSASALAGAMALASPMTAAYSSAVMTEWPTLLFLALAFIGWERAVGRSSASPAGASLWALGSGLMFGIAAILREPAAFLCAWPIASCLVDRPRGRWRLLALGVAGTGTTMAVGLGMAWRWEGVHPLIILHEYNEYMRLERETYGDRPLANLGFLFTHFVVASPLAAVALGGWLARRVAARRNKTVPALPPLGRRLRWLALSSLPCAAITWYNPDLVFNYRLMMPLVWVLLPAAATAGEAMLAWLMGRLRVRAERRTAAATAAVLGLSATAFAAGLVFLSAWYFADARNKVELYGVMTRLPKDAVVISGPGSPIGLYLNGTRIRADLRNVMTDFGWTGDRLTERVTLHIRSGRRVYANLRKLGWLRPLGKNRDLEWRALMDMVRRFDTRPAAGPFKELVLPTAPPVGGAPETATRR